MKRQKRVYGNCQMFSFGPFNPQDVAFHFIIEMEDSENVDNRLHPITRAWLRPWWSQTHASPWTWDSCATDNILAILSLCFLQKHIPSSLHSIPRYMNESTIGIIPRCNVHSYGFDKPSYKYLEKINIDTNSRRSQWCLGFYYWHLQISMSWRRER